MWRFLLRALVFCPCLFASSVADGQTLEKRLRAQDSAALAAAARKQGDAQRGAIVFFQPHMACTKCHAVDGKQNALGPDLTKLGKDATDVHLVESVLLPTKAIRKGYDSVTVVTAAGKTITGLVVKETGAKLVLRDIQQNGRITRLSKKDIVQRAAGAKSIMPEGQVNQLASRQQFLDLVRYLIEIRDGGLARARQLQPPPWAYAVRIPEYEKRIDHAGMIAGFDNDGFKRGEAIYNRLCVNCHGTHEKPGSLPTSLRFAEGKFKNGSDPFTMYQTLTRGFGMMTPQNWMAPQQKYDVIHYVREAYLKSRNRSQYFKIEDGYLTGLPKGDTRGPKPTDLQPWINMNYGASLMNTYEIGSDGSNFAYKGIAVRLNPGPGGVSRGNAWMIFDHDTLRMAAAWTGSGFIDFNGIHFNGRHQVHPRIVGQVHLANPTGPGWANPKTGGFVDDLRVEGRDGRRYGPLPKPWARYLGLYHHGQQVLLAYAIGETEVLEKPGLLTTESGQVFTRTFNIAPRKRPMTLQIARHPARTAQLHIVRTMQDKPAIAVLTSGGGKAKPAASQSPAVLVAGMSPHVAESTWLKSDAGDLRLRIPPGERPLKFTLWMASLNRSDQALAMADAVDLQRPDIDLEPLTRGGPPRWPQRLKTEAVIGEGGGPFAVDVLRHPVNNPWLAQMRLTGFDFFPDGDRAAVCAWDGDVWLVRGLNGLPAAGPREAGRKVASRPTLEWQRIASGLFQPLGVKIVRGQIYVTCRDQLVVLHDRNGDGETDFYQCFNNDHQVTEHFHEFAMGLQTDAQGAFYYAKSARHALKAIVPHHGTLLRISPDGKRTDILATGFRAANGVCLNPDGTFFVTDQEGHWMPKNRINWVKDGGFYGNMFGYHDVTDTSDAAMRQPLCWITNKFDRSPAELLWVASDKWGPLKGSLLNLSYGYGKIYTVPHEKIDGQMQGGMSPLPLPQFPTGAMRARFHPKDGQLYTSGMFAWAGSQQQPGGFYRVRYTGKPLHVATKLQARTTGMAITFSGALDRESAQRAGNFSVKTWSLKRTANYGSKHYDERSLEIKTVRISADGRTVFLEIPEIRPTWCMEISYSLKSSAGGSFRGVIHNTIHKLAK